MGSSQLRLSNNSHFCAIGDVKIHPSVAIAPGAVLEAAPGSRIEVAVGVCIGTGCVIQVQQGTLELAAGASLGGGVLIFGSGRVGANACIGSEATLLYPEVEDGAAIAAKSLIGDRSRQLAAAPEPETQSKPRLEPTVSAADKESVNGAVSPDEENPDTQKLN
ncbi:MAG: hypothetical protein HC873_23080 [Leptolyngbyaceae cyanobacterium SL_1_1]|nr:hypothetical protein [Leptolyngbyaceae cyanobacterium SL_1_1]